MTDDIDPTVSHGEEELSEDRDSYASQEQAPNRSLFGCAISFSRRSGDGERSPIPRSRGAHAERR